MKLVTVSEMRSIEQQADAAGLSYAQMMENAGAGLAEVVDQLAYSRIDGQVALGLVGPGNNGGDTLVALAALAERGWTACACLVRRSSDGDPLVERLTSAGGRILAASDDTDHTALAEWLGQATVLLDGLLGTGIQLPLRGEIADMLEFVRTSVDEKDWPPFVVAVDCPSGVDCDSGAAAEQVIPADLTVTMAAVKQGLLRLPAFDLAGELRVVGIGLPDDLPAWAALTSEVADEDLVRAILPERPADAHKGTFGTALIAAGSVNYTGAAWLAGRAAYRIGAGLVTLAVPAPLHAALAGSFPEATWVLLPHELGVIAEPAADVLARQYERASALLIGPGFGLEETTLAFLRAMLKGVASPRKSGGRIGFVRANDGQQAEPEERVLPPLVVDADGLKLLAQIDGWPELLPAPAVLTPHPGEMSVLTGLDKDAIQSDRLAIARKYAAEWGHVVVLKGAFTVVAAPDGHATVIPMASAALARAGTGDVLAGLIVGLRAQSVEAYPAAVAGAWIHAMAGAAAAAEIGSSAAVLAGDVLDYVVDVLAGMND